MLATIEEKIGIEKVAGLAAPQCGQSIRMFIFQSKGPRAGENTYPPTIAINPEIISHSNETEIDNEACFSLPLLTERNIHRYSSITCRYTTPEGNQVETVLGGFAARVFQHELDHLNGILAIDHTDDIVFKENEKLINEVLNITTGKNLSDLFQYNPEKGEYERKEQILTPNYSIKSVL